MSPLRSLKLRFILLFVVFIVILCASMSGIAIWQTIRVASNIFISEGMLVVEQAVSLIDGDSFEGLAATLDSDDPFYEETRRKLLELKQLSRCRYLYTMAPVEGSRWRFIIDGSAAPGAEHFSPLGTPEDTSDYDDAFLEVWNTKKPVASKIEYLEPYGWILSMYAPVLNTEGAAVGIVGCDFGAEDLFNTIRINALGQVVVVLICMAIGLVLVSFSLRALFGRFININTDLETVLGTISAGEEDLARWVRVRCKGEEIKDLSYFFSTTMAKIRIQVLSIQKHSLNVFRADAEGETGKE